MRTRDRARLRMQEIKQTRHTDALGLCLIELGFICEYQFMGKIHRPEMQAIRIFSFFPSA